MRFGQFAQTLDDPFLARDVMPLKLDVNLIPSESMNDAPQNTVSLVSLFSENRRMQRAFAVAGQGDETLMKFLQLVPKDAAFALRCAKLSASDHPAQVLITSPIHD